METGNHAHQSESSEFRTKLPIQVTRQVLHRDFIVFHALQTQYDICYNETVNDKFQLKYQL